MFYRFIRAVFRVLAAVLMPTKVIGRERLKREGGYILVCNHQTAMDIPALMAACPRTIHFMAKSTFFDKPVVGFLFKKLHAFPVHSNTADMQAIRQGIKVLKQGEVLGVFPQGTRRKYRPILLRQEVYGGVALLALKAQAVIVPAMFEKSPLLFQRNVLHVGEEIDLKKYAGEKINQELLERVTDEYTEAMNRLLAGTGAVNRE